MGTRAGQFELRSISPDATPQEVAAITAAITASLAAMRAEQRLSAAADEDGSRWVSAARLTARRAPYSRGEWRLSGRIGRRSRA